MIESPYSTNGSRTTVHRGSVVLGVISTLLYFFEVRKKRGLFERFAKWRTKCYLSLGNKRSVVVRRRLNLLFYKGSIPMMRKRT